MAIIISNISPEVNNMLLLNITVCTGVANLRVTLNGEAKSNFQFTVNENSIDTLLTHKVILK